MSYNQKMLAVISVIAAGITIAISLVLFDPPYSTNFKVEVAFIVLSQILAGMTLVAKLRFWHLWRGANMLIIRTSGQRE